MNVDISTLISKVIGVNVDITGYRGTDSMPDCDYVICWYVLQTPFTLTTDQYNFFVMSGQPWNARQNNLSTNPDAYQTVYNLAPWAAPLTSDL